jgi:hypothetical protein
MKVCYGQKHSSLLPISVNYTKNVFLPFANAGKLKILNSNSSKALELEQI